MDFYLNHGGRQLLFTLNKRLGQVNCLIKNTAFPDGLYLI